MKTVLFIGTHGVFRSKYAEAYFNSKIGNLPVQAISRGTWMNQGRRPRFKRAWNDQIKACHYSPFASKLQYLDMRDADIRIGMYEPEQRAQLSYKQNQLITKKTSGTWDLNHTVDTEYWKVPNLHGTGDCHDGNEIDDPYKILEIIEYYVDDLMENLQIHITN